MSRLTFLSGWKLKMRTEVLIKLSFGLAMICTLAGTSVLASNVKVSWTANSDADLAGYKILYGTASHNYSNTIDVGKVTTYLVTGLNTGTYYFALLAYDTSGNQSTLSSEMSVTITSTSVADFTLTKSHIGNFTQGQNGAVYSLKVTNVGTSASSGTVTVTDQLPAGLTAAGMSGTGWSCILSTLTCTRGDSLAAGGSYPLITLTVNVGANAPSSLINAANVSGGGDSNSANNSASDATAITAVTTSPISISNVVAPSQIGKYDKFEISFDVLNSVATNPQLPYDPAPPSGIDPNYEGHKGITVDAEFSPDNWATIYRQPAFFFVYYDDGGNKSSWDGHLHEWYYPTGKTGWKVRFAPSQVGTWQYRLKATDGSGSTISTASSFTVNSSTKKGFVRNSAKDPRYFEFDDGSLFLSQGVQAAGRLDDPIKNNEADFVEFQKNGINLIRNWISGLYGAAWPQWLGGRNIYDGYLPRAGLLPFHDSVRNRDVMTMYLKYPEGWFDACQFEGWDDSEPVKPNTTYKLSIKYWGQEIAGPRVAGYSKFGLVGKIAEASVGNCYEPGTGSVVTTYGGNTSDWGTIEGLWNSGSNNFLPKVSLGLENVTQGKAFVLSISVREVLSNGQLGPEIMQESSMQYEINFPDAQLYAMDKYVGLAEKYDMYLKLVMSEKNDLIFTKMDDDGTFVINGEQDNQDGFYGLGRGLNKTRWLQKAWWRYLQARWGYSPNVHSWELTNEGDPFLTQHWEMTDEMGKFMHCGAFGVSTGSGDSQPCTLKHPNRHLVTTSFWHSFPGYDPASGNGFWASPKYPNVDYADVHAYITTSPAPDADKILMQTDAAYYHLWHSKEYGGWKFKFPIIRGEAGMTPYNTNTDDWTGLGLQTDKQGVWYHNYVWSGLDSGALYEVYYHYMHIVDPGNYDHRSIVQPFTNFMKGIPLNNGQYQDLAAQVSDANLRVVGQRDSLNGSAYAWIQNKNHTWKNVVGGVSISPVSGSLTISGFSPSQTYAVEWWNPYVPTSQITSTQSVTAASDGSLTISVASLATDVALKISKGGSTNVTADLTIIKKHTGSFKQGQTGALYTMVVSNVGTAASNGTVTATDTLPAGLTATGMSGTGWTCMLGTVTCTRADSLGAAASYPAITLTVNVASNAAATVNNTATVSGDGDGNLANNTVVDVTSVDSWPLVTLTVTDGNGSETGSDVATLQVTRTGSTSAGLTVSYTVGGSATNGVDYQGISGTVIIPAGATSANITVTPINDTAVEGNETVVLTLATGSGYSVGTPGSGTATIWDSDSKTTISSVTVPFVDSKSSSVAWLTDVPADSQVQYGTTTTYGTSTTLDSTMITNHTMKISGLKSGTTYHFQVKSKNSAGTAATSNDYTFKTLMGPPGRVRRK